MRTKHFECVSFCNRQFRKYKFISHKWFIKRIVGKMYYNIIKLNSNINYIIPLWKINLLIHCFRRYFHLPNLIWCYKLFINHVITSNMTNILGQAQNLKHLLNKIYDLIYPDYNNHKPFNKSSKTTLINHLTLISASFIHEKYRFP